MAAAVRPPTVRSEVVEMQTIYPRKAQAIRAIGIRSMLITIAAVLTLVLVVSANGVGGVGLERPSFLVGPSLCQLDGLHVPCS
jgi:hypothetical protein